MQSKLHEVVVKKSSVAKPIKAPTWQERRDDFKKRLEQTPLTLAGADELEAHFSGMPSHYWESVNEQDLRWGLETVHGFLEILMASKTPPTMPFVNYRQEPGSQRTRVMLCTWDRQGLLAKSAASFSAVKLNILRADVFTRADNVVLDLFQVANSESAEAITATQMQNMSSLLDGALSEPPRFASVWACSRHKYLAEPDPAPPRIEIDNETSPNTTIVRVEAYDRLGLLYDILQTINDSGYNVTQALIQTEDVMARDTIHIKDAQCKKVTASEQLATLRHHLETALIR